MENLIARGRIAVLAGLLGAAFLALPAAGATDITDIGTLDQSVLASIPSFQAANRQLQQYGEGLQKQYNARAAHASQGDQAKLAAEFRG